MSDSGFLRNCEVTPRGDETLFEQTDDGAVICRLDGYRIEPVETHRERMAIVAWMRKHYEDTLDGETGCLTETSEWADKIEAGEHLKEAM